MYNLYIINKFTKVLAAIIYTFKPNMQTDTRCFRYLLFVKIQVVNSIA